MGVLIHATSRGTRFTYFQVMCVCVVVRSRNVFRTCLSCVVDFTPCGRRRRYTWRICTTNRCFWEMSISWRLCATVRRSVVLGLLAFVAQCKVYSHLLNVSLVLRATAVPARRNGNRQPLFCVPVVTSKRCPTLSTLVDEDKWRLVSSTMKLLPGWPVLALDAHAGRIGAARISELIWKWVPDSGSLWWQRIPDVWVMYAALITWCL